MRFVLSLLLLTAVARAEPLRRISICDAQNSPKTRLAKGGWTFCDGQHWLTENEFIRQYGLATGQHDLDRHLTMRSRTRWIVAAVLGGVGLGVMTYGLATLGRPYAETAAALGGATFGAATVTFLAGPGRDGSPTDHSLNRFAADVMVKRYQIVAQF